MDNKKIGEKIKAKRIASGLTQKQMADILLVSDKNYSKMERGDISIGSEYLRKICMTLGISEIELLGDLSVHDNMYEKIFHDYISNIFMFPQEDYTRKFMEKYYSEEEWLLFKEIVKTEKINEDKEFLMVIPFMQFIHDIRILNNGDILPYLKALNEQETKRRNDEFSKTKDKFNDISNNSIRHNLFGVIHEASLIPDEAALPEYIDNNDNNPDKHIYFNKLLFERKCGIIIGLKNGNAFLDGGLKINFKNGIKTYPFYVVYVDHDDKIVDDADELNGRNFSEWIKELRVINKKLRLDGTITSGWVESEEMAKLVTELNTRGSKLDVWRH